MGDHADTIELIGRIVELFARKDAEMRGKRYSKKNISRTHVDAAILYIINYLGAPDDLAMSFADPPVSYVTIEDITGSGFSDRCAGRMRDACNGLILLRADGS